MSEKVLEPSFILPQAFAHVGLLNHPTLPYLTPAHSLDILTIIFGSGLVKTRLCSSLYTSVVLSALTTSNYLITRFFLLLLKYKRCEGGNSNCVIKCCVLTTWHIVKLLEINYIYQCKKKLRCWIHWLKVID